jgi:hypothetical protein
MPRDPLHRGQPDRFRRREMLEHGALGDADRRSNVVRGDKRRTGPAGKPKGGNDNFGLALTGGHPRLHSASIDNEVVK